MTEETKKAAKHHLWKWIGSLMMETKQDASGTTHMAVSLSKFIKLITLIMAVALFITMVVFWTAKYQIGADGVIIDPVPDSMMNVLFSLLGLTGANQISSAVAKRTGARD